jgi:hypothetical protein
MIGDSTLSPFDELFHAGFRAQLRCDPESTVSDFASPAIYRSNKSMNFCLMS